MTRDASAFDPRARLDALQRRFVLGGDLTRHEVAWLLDHLDQAFTRLDELRPFGSSAP